jgi:DNA mismatch endonuclease (patch repair protein)
MFAVHLNNIYAVWVYIRPPAGQRSAARMVDIFTPEKRSAVMARIRGRDTKPELALRSMLHRMGYRFTVGGPKNRTFPGRPDLVLPKLRTVVFVHGCFWHGHAGCKHFRLPKSRRAWWRAKIAGNQARDRRNEDSLRAMGWHVVTVWSCALDTIAAREWLKLRLPALLGPPAAQPALPKVADDEAVYGRGGPEI